MSQRRQQTVPERATWIVVAACGEAVVVDTTGGVQDTPGVRGRARGDSSMRNRRDPTRRPTSGEGGAYKPTAKWRCAGRESEGFIVPLEAGGNFGGGKGPCFGYARGGGKCEGMTVRSNYPVDKARERRSELYMAAKLSQGSWFRAGAARLWWGDVPSRGVVTLLSWRSARVMRRPSVSRVREIRTHGLKGGLRKRTQEGHRA